MLSTQAQGYRKYLSNWSKEAGHKPAGKTVKEAELFARAGSKTAFALSLFMRPDGATRKQIVSVLGKPQMNKMRDLVTKGKLVDRSTEKDGIKVYRLSLPKKKVTRK